MKYVIDFNAYNDSISARKTHDNMTDGGNKTPKQIFFPQLLPTQQLHEKPLHVPSTYHRYPSLYPLILMPYNIAPKILLNSEFVKPSLDEHSVDNEKSRSDITKSSELRNNPQSMNGQIKYRPIYLQNPITKVSCKSIKLGIHNLFKNLVSRKMVMLIFIR